MNRNQIEKMVSDLVNEIDYDIWKEYFLRGHEDLEPDEVPRKEILIDMVEEHMERSVKLAKKAKKTKTAKKSKA